MTKIRLICALALSLFPILAVPGQADEPTQSAWNVWTESTTRLRGANVYQEVNERDPTQWYPLLRFHDFQDLRLAGANWVNLSVPGPFDPKTGQCDPNNWRHLRECVEMAGRAGFKVVIAFRTGPGRNERDITGNYKGDIVQDLLDDPDSPNVARFCEMWRVVAKEFAHQPHVVGFDLLVEPHAKLAWEKEKYHDWHFRDSKRWPNVAEKAIAAIRTVTNSMPILVEPEGFAAAFYLHDVDDRGPNMCARPWVMPKGDKLVCAVHQYVPTDYTHGGKIAFDPMHTQLKEVFELIRRWRQAHPRIPLCVNEFGVGQEVSCAEAFLVKELCLLEEQNLNHAVWLWEVTDPTYEYREFDVRSNPSLMRALKTQWSKNLENLRVGNPCNMLP